MALRAVPHIDFAGRPWSIGLYHPSRYKVLHGGRGGGKSWAFAEALVWHCCKHRIRAVVARQFGTDHGKSLIPLITDTIESFGLTKLFRIQEASIENRITGSEITFTGLERNTATLRGWEKTKILWIEEAQAMNSHSWEIIRNTVRTVGSEIWMSFNPMNRVDPSYRLVMESPSGSYIRRVNWRDNPFFPETLEKERLLCLETQPDRYGHVWEGQPDEGGSGKRVLDYRTLQACVEAWEPKYATGTLQAGLDIADAGIDFSALAMRRGPCLMSIERWSEGDRTVPHTIHEMNRTGAEILFYDEGGIGGSFHRQLPVPRHGRKWGSEGVNFGSGVCKPDVRFNRGCTNRDFFARRNAQLAWAVRLRAMATEFKEWSHSPERCLFINPEIPRLEEVMSELSTPEWREDASGRIAIEKQPKGEPSPDRYDALVLAFAKDSERGLTDGEMIGPTRRSKS